MVGGGGGGGGGAKSFPHNSASFCQIINKLCQPITFYDFTMVSVFCC